MENEQVMKLELSIPENNLSPLSLSPKLNKFDDNKKRKKRKKRKKCSEISRADTCSIDPTFGSVSSIGSYAIRENARIALTERCNNAFIRKFDWLWKTDYNFEVVNYTRCYAKVIISSVCLNIDKLSLTGGSAFGFNVEFDHKKKSTEKTLNSVGSGGNRAFLPVRSSVCYLTILLIDPSQYITCHDDITKWRKSEYNLPVSTSKYARFNILRNEEFLCPSVRKHWI